MLVSNITQAIGTQTTTSLVNLLPLIGMRDRLLKRLDQKWSACSTGMRANKNNAQGGPVLKPKLNEII